MNFYTLCSLFEQGLCGKILKNLSVRISCCCVVLNRFFRCKDFAQALEQANICQRNMRLAWGLDLCVILAPKFYDWFQHVLVSVESDFRRAQICLLDTAFLHRSCTSTVIILFTFDKRRLCLSILCKNNARACPKYIFHGART